MKDIAIVILSFEGPDPYSHAGGLGSRATELSRTLASLGLETHLFFIGDPELPGYEVIEDGRLHLHRWCQWISSYHPQGVYDGEEDKLRDWDQSLPDCLLEELIGPKVHAGESVVVIAEEWHTANSILSLHDMVVQREWQDQVKLIWNANNTFSFYRIDWERLKESATITTVSRYMKHRMWTYGVDAHVIPNGISDSWLQAADSRAVSQFSRLARGRLTLAKVARWDPDKRWNITVDAVAEMKRLGLRPLLFARGGVGEHKYEVLDHAAHLGLRTTQACWKGGDEEHLLEALRPVVEADVVDLQGYLSQAQRKVLFKAANVVLANSGVEPFGLVGLETMSVGGLAFVGCTGEDYVTHGYDSVAIQTSNPREIVHYALYLRNSRETVSKMRKAARRTAERYTWTSVIQRVLFPFLRELGLPVPLRASDTVPYPVYAKSHVMELPEQEQRGGEGTMAEKAQSPAKVNQV